MSSWIFRLALCGAVTALCSAAVPREWRKYTDMAGTLIFLIALLSPIRNLENFNADSLLADFERRADIASNAELMTEIRENELSDYLTAKALELGVECHIEVELDKSSEEMNALGAEVTYGTRPESSEIESVDELIGTYAGLPPGKISHFESGGDIGW